MDFERMDCGRQEKEPDQTYPVALFCGYCKSGTTIITKTVAHCTNQRWNNEVRELWGIGATIDRSKPLPEFHAQFEKEDRWLNAQNSVSLAPILKFPEGILIIDLFPPETSVVCVVRNPLDTVCAYLERQHEFTTLDFTEEQLVARAEDWNYHYLAASQSKRSIGFICYENFVNNPQDVVESASRLLNLSLQNQLPEWLNEQAQPYYRYVREGQEVRGVGRYRLSIKSQEVVDSVLEVCKPALAYLEKEGIIFQEVLH